MRVKREKSWVAGLIVLAWLWMNGIAAFHYEPWHDISQSWMIVRDLDLPGIFRQLSFEGHPCLWYMLLLPFVRLGFPFETIIVISLMLMLAALVLFLLYAPFRLPCKAVMAFSALFMFYLPVNARSYALVPLLLMLVYLAYPTRLTHPVRYACVLFLLCQVQVLLCGVCGALMAMWAWDALTALKQKKENIRPLACAAALLVMLAAVVFLYWQLKGSIDDNLLVEVNRPETATEIRHDFLWTLSLGSYYLFGGHFYDFGNTAWWLVLVPVALFAAGIGLWWMRKAFRSALIFGVSFVWQLFVHVFVYPQHRHHMLILFWILLLCIMLAQDEAKNTSKPEKRDEKLPRVLCAGMMVFCLLGYSYVYSDIQYECHPEKVNSFSKRVVEYVESELPEDAVIILDAEYKSTCVAAYLPQERIYNPTRHNRQAHFIQDEQPMMWSEGAVSLDEPVRELRAMGHTGEIYFLCDPSVENRVAQLSSQSEVKLTDCRSFTGESKYEQYLLYRVEETQSVGE